MTVAKVELGRYLFYDKRMSVNGKESCGTCHRQELAFTDGLARAQGATGEAHPRSSMSLVNVAYEPLLTWANPSLNSLEEQTLIPMLGEEPVELGLKGHEQEFLNTLRRDAIYQRVFPQAFPGRGGCFNVMAGGISAPFASKEVKIATIRAAVSSIPVLHRICLPTADFLSTCNGPKTSESFGHRLLGTSPLPGLTCMTAASLRSKT
jgi:cytochrome c peroxidase